MDSVIQKNPSRCFICHSRANLEWHHVYGAANKKISEKYKLMVRLCHFCHNEPPRGVHQNRVIRQALQAFVQKQAMEHYGWSVDDFRDRFHKSYV